ncbi:hypothetical protein JTB14_035023 [Gonioctena quinquepunctata]|nr:hypothetical protein JTB14_035023 [Gonioctena quinquepunctata]
MVSVYFSLKKRKKRTQNAVAQPELEQAGSESSVDSDDPIEQEENVWEDTSCAPVDHASVGLTENIESKTLVEVFELILNEEVIDYTPRKTNAYSETLSLSNRPETRHERFKIFGEIYQDELKKLFGLCLLEEYWSFLEAIPIPEDSNKENIMSCEQCYTMKNRKKTAWQCQDCIGKPLCGKMFPELA